jgi:signal transduction histidine kinase
MNKGKEETDLIYRQLATLIKLSNVLGFLPVNLPEILKIISREVGHLYPNHQCSIYLFKPNANLSLPEQLDHKNCYLTTKVSWFRENCPVARDGLPVLVTEPVDEAGCKCPYIEQKKKYHLCLPMEGGKQQIGLLCLAGDEPYYFSGNELEVMLSIANQTALALQRYRLFQQLQVEKLELKQANQEIGQLNRDLAIKLQQLQETQNQLVRTEKLATAGQLAADLAHEINNPVAIILSRLEYLQWQFEEGSNLPVLTKEFRVLEKHAQRIANLTHNLLSFTRPKEDNFTALDLNVLVEETISLFTKLLSRQKIEVNLKLAEGLPDTWGNWDQMQQVLINLIYNARDAMPQGGTLVFRSYSDISKTMNVLEVVDTGEGIEPQHLKRVFVPFFTTKQEHKGTGLGLAISYNIISQHGGQIEVDSKIGEGTAFRIELKALTGEKAGE